MLFDVIAEPDEKVNLLASEPALGAVLAEQIRHYGVESEPGRKDRELLQRLFKEIEDGQGPVAS